jgi:hypothetical protein
MAQREFLEYYYKVEHQYLEMKADLEDFTVALQNGYITEDKLEEVKSQIAELQVNYDRLTWVKELLDKPNRKKKQAHWEKQNRCRLNKLRQAKADDAAVIAENEAILREVNAELEKLTSQDKK